MNYLDVLDLSNNCIFGKIPTGTQLQSFNASSYARNSGLCGDPLPKCWTGAPPQSFELGVLYIHYVGVVTQLLGNYSHLKKCLL